MCEHSKRLSCDVRRRRAIKMAVSRARVRCYFFTICSRSLPLSVAIDSLSIQYSIHISQIKMSSGTAISEINDRVKSTTSGQLGLTARALRRNDRRTDWIHKSFKVSRPNTTQIPQRNGFLRLVALVFEADSIERRAAA